MNQELTQRIIGAIVLTALAAIFIPMLFEDPVDTSGQVVSELEIPEEPAITMNDTVSKLPRGVEDIAPLPDETAETPEKPGTGTNAELDSTTPPAEEQDMTGDMNDTEAMGEEGAPSDAVGAVDEEPIDKRLATPPAAKANTLDTGEVKEVPTIKKPAQVRPTTKVEPPKKSEADALAPKPTPTKAPGGLSRYYLQAGSFSKRENALSLSDTLRSLGMPVLLDTIKTGKGTMYRLRVGPELDKKRAAAMKGKLDQQNIHSILVTE